jgi:hypothetical protein
MKLRRVIRWIVYAANMWGMRKGYSIFVTRPEEKRPLGRSRHRWEDNIKMYFKGIGYYDVY